MAGTLRSVAADDLLRGYEIVSLQQIGRKRGIDVKGKSKAALISQLAPGLYDPETVARSLADLEPGEREALNYIILGGGDVETSSVRDHLVAGGTIEPPEQRTGYSHRESRGASGARGSRNFADIVARLGVLGLVFTATNSQRAKNMELGIAGERLFIPEAILKHLPAVTLPIETATPPETILPAAPDALLRDVYILLSFALDSPIPLTVRGLIPKRNLAQIASALRIPETVAAARGEDDLGRLPFLRAIAEHLRLLVSGAGTLRLGDDVTNFLSRPPGERRKALYDAYRKLEYWSELNRLPGIRVWPRDGTGGPGVLAARKRILSELAELPPGEWISIEHLSKRVHVRAPHFLLAIRRSPYSSYYYGSSYRPTPYHGENSLGLTFERTSGIAPVEWEDVEGAFIRGVVTEALHWLGLVDLASAGPGEAASAFRITRDGATLLHGRTPLSSLAEPHVVVQPNFQIFAFDPTGEDVLFMLDRIAKRVRAEHAVEYHLSKESVYEAQNRGIETADILAFLDRVSSSPVPQNVRRSLEEWGAQHERIVVRRSSLVQVEDPATLDALFADPVLQPLLGRRVAPTVATARQEHVSTIYSHLIKRSGAQDHPVPALSEGDDSWPHPVLTIDPQGHIQFRQRIPSMYIRHALQPFTEDGPDGTVRITANTLKEAARRKSNGAALQAADIIATLERYHVGPVPEETVAMIRRLAKDWGRGSLSKVTLLQVESGEIMADLLADPEIAPYLQPIPGSPNLAIAKADEVARVRSLLGARGMDLQEGAAAKKRR